MDLDRSSFLLCQSRSPNLTITDVCVLCALHCGLMTWGWQISLAREGAAQAAARREVAAAKVMTIDRQLPGLDGHLDGHD